MNDTDRFESQHVSCAHTNFRVHGWLESYTVSTRKQIQINLYVRHETQVLIFALWWESGAVTTHVHLKKGAVRQWLGTLAIESQDLSRNCQADLNVSCLFSASPHAPSHH